MNKQDLYNKIMRQVSVIVKESLMVEAEDLEASKSDKKPLNSKEGVSCPNCGSEDVTKKSVAKSDKDYDFYVCNDCDNEFSTKDISEDDDYASYSFEDFKNEFSDDKALIQAVYNQMGEDDEDFFVDMENVASNGASCGYSGFIYYNETCEFFDENKEHILDALRRDAEEFGNDNYTEVVMNFNDFDSDYYTRYDIMDVMGDYVDWEEAEEYDGAEEKTEDDLVQLKNLLAWYALEKVAYLAQIYMEDAAEKMNE